MGPFDPETGKDRHGRPQIINVQTVSDYLHNDILAFDRTILVEENRQKPYFPMQRIIAREFQQRMFLWLQMMRGGSKTYTIARCVLDWCLMNQGLPAILTGPSFRQALLIFDEIVKIIEANDRNENSPFKLKNEIMGDIRRNTMESIIKFRNGSLIKAVPMGDGSKIRGLRGGLLVVDEFYLMTEEMYESHIMPFAGVKQGKLESKIVLCTTSWYQDTFAYRRLLQMAAEVKAGNPDYGILDFNLEDLVECNFPLSKNIWKDAQRHGNPQTFAMTYYNIWPSSISRWYEQAAIDGAQSMRHGVKIELKRPKDEQSPYVMIVDLAASEKGDSTVMLIAKIDEDGAEKFVYGLKGRGWGGQRRALEAQRLRERFNPTYIVYDAHGAIGKDFRTDMASEKLIVDGKVHNVTPAIHHDENNRRGDRVMVPVTPREDAVIHALTGVRDGFLDGEDGMNNLLHTKCKNLLWEGKILGPASTDDLDEETAQKTEYLGSEEEALDVVREAFAQLANISLEKTPDGQQKMTKSGQMCFKSKYGVSRDDGAYCIIYSTIALLMFETIGQNKRPNNRTRAMSMRPVTSTSTADAANVTRQVLAFS